MSGAAFEDFDVTMRQPPAGAKAAAAEFAALQVASQLQEFMDKVLPRLNDEQVRKLRCALPAPKEAEVEDEGDEYGAEFSVANEISQQLKTVRALRKQYFPDGRPKPDVPLKEFQGVLTLTGNMIKMLMKAHEDIMDMERSRLVEAAIVDVLLELGDKRVIEAVGFDPREKFLAQLEVKLEAVN